ncbi:uncharacterized protein [Nicotiana tomentosiformis]|uniref:uncharacterized protein n=1 Tax=Nicotiana tomentosiformis TaxID=4098 RepID=UPI00388CD222
MPVGKFAKWKVVLSEFDIVYITQKAIKGQALTDHLIENLVDRDYEPLTTYLLIHQVQGEWSTKNVKILPYLHCMKELCKKFMKIEFKHVPRILNGFADALATLSSMIQHPDKNYIDLIVVEIMDQHAYCFLVDEEPYGKPWYHHIKRFLATKEYPKNATNSQKRDLRRFTLAKKILRAGYFWMTMESDNIRYVQTCHQCQIHNDFIRVPLNELNVMGSPWPFAAWGMDMIGPIEPVASNRHRFILLSINYFTKWVEASTYKAVTKKVVTDFVRNNIVCRFGILESIIIDNADNLNNDFMREICEKFRIIHRNSTA